MTPTRRLERGMRSISALVAAIVFHRLPRREGWAILGSILLVVAVAIASVLLGASAGTASRLMEGTGLVLLPIAVTWACWPGRERRRREEET